MELPHELEEDLPVPTLGKVIVDHGPGQVDFAKERAGDVTPTDAVAVAIEMDARSRGEQHRLHPLRGLLLQPRPYVLVHDDVDQPHNVIHVVPPYDSMSGPLPHLLEGLTHVPPCLVRPIVLHEIEGEVGDGRGGASGYDVGVPNDGGYVIAGPLREIAGEEGGTSKSDNRDVDVRVVVEFHPGYGRRCRSKGVAYYGQVDPPLPGEPLHVFQELRVLVHQIPPRLQNSAVGLAPLVIDGVHERVGEHVCDTLGPPHHEQNVERRRPTALPLFERHEVSRFARGVALRLTVYQFPRIERVLQPLPHLVHRIGVAEVGEVQRVVELRDALQVDPPLVPMDPPLPAGILPRVLLLEVIKDGGRVEPRKVEMTEGRVERVCDVGQDPSDLREAPRLGGIAGVDGLPGAFDEGLD
mmetsp:Transcript_62243/g.184109  ORF Transcript_62243/g.184109 Transcript_62243/m.184109 type:complete len:411 (-) Transcript_62243:554-1786(-)